MVLTGCQGPDQGGFNYQDNLDSYDGASAGAGADPGLGDMAGVAVRPEGGLLRVGDRVVVTFAEAPERANMLPHDEKIKEDGTLTLPLIGSVPATNRTTGQLQREIQERYVPDYFPRLTVTVRVGDLFFTVSGEVREPSRQTWLTKITLVQAIASARGFTDFANEKKVQIIRADGISETVNYRDILTDPTKDVNIYPGDRIIVPKRWF
jgi:polysaccharide export outer membrane protein